MSTFQSFQERVRQWMASCFGSVISNDLLERNHRFIEEALELVQAFGCTRSEALQLVDYVYGRPAGDPRQEIGGVLVTLAALCQARRIDMGAAGEHELERIWTVIDVIRAKQAAKPKYGPLPAHTHEGETPIAVATLPAAWRDVLDERVRQTSMEGWTPEHDDQHTGAELAQAAMAYTQASFAAPWDSYEDYSFWWPDGWDAMKHKTPREDLVRAGALILAEIERLDRAAQKNEGKLEEESDHVASCRT